MPDSSNPFRISKLDPKASFDLSMRQGLEGKLRQVQAVKNHQASQGVTQATGKGESLEDMQKAGTQFEALLLHEMLKEMWNTIPKDGMLSGSHEENLYRDMLNEGIANDIAEKQSLGIRDVLVKDMQKFQKK